MRKGFKVKNDAVRVALIELLVEKRVRFLEYLSELHRDEVLWMGTVRLTRQDVVKYFSGNNNSGGHRGENNSVVYRLPTAPPVTEEALLTKEEVNTEDIMVKVKSIPGLPQTVGSSWLSAHIPCYLCLALSLADILRVELSRRKFIECLYALLLEMDVRFAGGTAAKAIAQLNLRNYRQQQQQMHLVESLSSLGANNSGNASSTSSVSFAGGGGGSSSSNNNSSSGAFLHGVWDAENQVKYYYLNLEHLAYMKATDVRYEDLFIPLCSHLILAYKRFSDYDMTNSEESAKRVLSIDRRLQQLFFTVISKELEKIARGKLLQQTLLLSTDGLFAGLGGTRGNAQSLLQDLLGRTESSTISTVVTTNSSGGGNKGDNKVNAAEAFSIDSDEEEEEEEEGL
ncbi:uncharacterized protein TM35_000391860 [Trypanosoma theileri]|uniref:Uncharacterized protein n=1 Tax=Trypanosoma theileri TaxID=67003 RepID=A0A1X0NJT7_9TRYP|nr:uncharacterized protein TM35_000391860 [Trypanosoma theileri]ORC85012.1 hypothetical protein TM35_000391860 [Trypanosoma theileri]